MGMNADAGPRAQNDICLEKVWLCSIRIVLVVAWAFNLVILAAAVLSAWRGADSGRVLGVGFLFVWLLLTGMVVVRTSVAVPDSARLASSG
jgi:hypothetical protein